MRIRVILALFVIFSFFACSDDIIEDLMDDFSSSASQETSTASVSSIASITSASSVASTSSVASVEPASLEETMRAVLPNNVVNLIDNGDSLLDQSLAGFASIGATERDLVAYISDLYLCPSVGAGATGGSFSSRLHSIYLTGNPIQNEQQIRTTLFPEVASPASGRQAVAPRAGMRSVSGFVSDIADIISPISSVASALSGVCSFFGLGASTEKQTLKIVRRMEQMLSEVNQTLIQFKQETQESLGRINDKLDYAIGVMATKNDINFLYNAIAEIGNLQLRLNLTDIKNWYDTLMNEVLNSFTDEEMVESAKSMSKDLPAKIKNFISFSKELQTVSVVQSSMPDYIDYNQLFQNYPALTGVNKYYYQCIAWIPMYDSTKGYLQIVEFDKQYSNPRKCANISSGNLEYVINMVIGQLRLLHIAYGAEEAIYRSAVFASDLLNYIKKAEINLANSILAGVNALKQEYTNRLNAFDMRRNGQSGPITLYENRPACFSSMFEDDDGVGYLFEDTIALLARKSGSPMNPTSSGLRFEPWESGLDDYFDYLGDYWDTEILSLYPLGGPSAGGFRECITEDYLKLFTVTIGDIASRYVVLETILRSAL